MASSFAASGIDPRSRAGFYMAILAILIKRAGGSVTITQSDLDDIASGRLEEYSEPHNDAVVFQLIERKDRVKPN